MFLRSWLGVITRGRAGRLIKRVQLLSMQRAVLTAVFVMVELGRVSGWLWLLPGIFLSVIMLSVLGL